MMEQFQSMMEMMKLLETMQDFSGGENNDEQSESGFRKSTEWITEPEQNLMDQWQQAFRHWSGKAADALFYERPGGIEKSEWTDAVSYGCRHTF